MRLLLAVSVALACIALVLAVLGRTFLDGTPSTWFLASWATFVADAAVGGHLTRA